MKILNWLWDKFKYYVLGIGVTFAATMMFVSGGEIQQGSDLQKGLIGQWDLAQESLKSATVFADLTPYGNDGTITAGTGGSTTDQRGQAN